MTDSHTVQRWDINIVILGGVSAGKTTLVNTILTDTYSSMKIRRTTMVPQIYREMDLAEAPIDPNVILDRNQTINNALLEKSKNGTPVTYDDIAEAEYFVPTIKDFVKLRDKVHLSIYDTPGLNDAHTKEIYFRYIRENFHKFDIILLVVDVTSGMNTSDEMDILRLIIENIAANQKMGIHNHLMVVVNKCDDMYSNDNEELVMDAEIKEMYDQTTLTINREIANSGIEFTYDIVPLSCQDAYVYRTYINSNTKSDLSSKYQNKIGIDEFGKKVWNAMPETDRSKFIKNYFKNTKDVTDLMVANGFNQFRTCMQNNLKSQQQYTFLRNRCRYFWHTLMAADPIYNPSNSVDISNQHTACLALRRKYNLTDNKSNDSIMSYFELMFGRYYRTIYESTNLADITYVECIQKHFIELLKIVKQTAAELSRDFIRALDDLTNIISGQYMSRFMELFDSDNVDVEMAINYMDTLKENNCRQMHIPCIKYIRHQLPKIFTEFSSEAEQELFELVQYFVSKYELESEDIIAIILGFLPKLYCLYLNIQPDNLLVIKQFFNMIATRLDTDEFLKIATYLEVLSQHLTKYTAMTAQLFDSEKFDVWFEKKNISFSLSIEKYLESNLMMRRY